jgi:hypothetical protein
MVLRLNQNSPTSRSKGTLYCSSDLFDARFQLFLAIIAKMDLFYYHFIKFYTKFSNFLFNKTKKGAEAPIF